MHGHLNESIRREASLHVLCGIYLDLFMKIIKKKLWVKNVFALLSGKTEKNRIVPICVYNVCVRFTHS